MYPYDGEILKLAFLHLRLPMNAHFRRVSGKARRGILLAQSVIFLIGAPEHLVSQTAGLEPMAPQIGGPPDQVPPLLTERDAEPIASDQNSAPLAKVTEKPVSPEATPSKPVDEVKRYLWGVYQRSSTKMDSHGDFTWKDGLAADVWGLSMEDYVIGGMDPDFRELLFAAGRAMDAAGIDWSILAGFRDDFRQSLAVGLRARGGNSFHGGSVATGGYGHGCAADLASSDGLTDDKVWNWLDLHGQQFGLYRPLRAADPAHLQPTPGWHQLAVRLRDERRAVAADTDRETAAATELDSTPSGAAISIPLSEEKLTCSHVRHFSVSNKVYRTAVRTHGPRVAVSKEHHNHSHDKTAHDHSHSISRNRSAQDKGRKTRSRRAHEIEAGPVFAKLSTTSP
jgi:hypothetical protein